MPESLIQRFFANADRLGSRPMAYFHTGSFWVPVGWRTAAEMTRDFASGLMELGQEKGDALAIVSNTRHEWQLADLGNMAAGGVTVGVYPTMTAEQMRYVIAHCDARYIVVENKDLLDRVLSFRSQLPRVEKIIVIDTAGIEPQADLLSMKDLLAQGRAAKHDVDGRIAKLELEDACTFIYTSGTTGPPKGAMLTHGNVSAALEMFSAVSVYEGDSGFCFLPLAHALQRGVNYVGIWQGIEGKFGRSIETVADDLAICAPTIVASVPRIFEKVYAKINEQAAAGSPAKQRIFQWALGVGRQVSQHRQSHEPLPRPLEMQYRVAKALVFNKLRAKLGGRIRLFFTGGAPIAKEILEFFDAADITILEGWGMTETFSAGTLNLPGAMRFGSIGRPLQGVEMRLDEDGEILIRGPNVFAGYYKDEEATRTSFTEDGYFRTGDVGRVDADGYYYIIDRKKDLIITAGGKNVAPQNIENLIKSDPRISQVMVVGDRRPYLAALISVAPEVAEKHSETELRQMVESIVNEKNQELARYEQVRKFRILPKDLSQEAGELTPTLKVKRKVVTERYQSLIDDMYAEAKPAQESSRAS